ncbi:uncharacterized protein LOC115891698 [Sitophilus oryzae]|uniref:Uncharacterized protein LOC115891698 n=1 Tax=Sitophilus oryzae TaxID=7048 RepID=A0A6J2YXX7_SITOR|nr:uncharacterized protein LOC115891698 [Sitophilus oryzae]
MIMPNFATFLLLLFGILSTQFVNAEFRKTFSKNCDKSYTLTCLKLDIVTWVDKLNTIEGYSVLPGISIVRENNASADINVTETVTNLAREFPNDPDARLDAFLLKKVSGFIENHSIRLKLWNENTDGSTARKGGGGGGFGGGGGGGGGKGGKGGDGGMGYILAAGAMMKGTLMAMAMAGLAAMAGKALMASLIALMLAALSGLKGMGGGGKTTYEVVAKPVYTQSSSHSVSHEDYGHGHSGYGRSLDQPLPLALQPGYYPDH